MSRASGALAEAQARKEQIKSEVAQEHAVYEQAMRQAAWAMRLLRDKPKRRRG